MTNKETISAQERVRERALVAWANSIIKRRGFKITKFPEDFADGTLLNVLYESLSGKTLKLEKNAKFEVQKITNLNLILQGFAEDGAQSTCSAESVLKGNSKMILGLLWCLLRRYQLQGPVSQDDAPAVTTQQTTDSTGSTEKPVETKPQPKEDPIVALARKEAEASKLPFDPKEKISVNLQNGVLLCAFVKNRVPEANEIEMEKLNKDDAVTNLNLAFRTAEKWLDIPQLFDAEDVAECKVEDSILYSYISYFRTAVKRTPPPEPTPVPEPVVSASSEEIAKLKAEIEEQAKVIASLQSASEEHKKQAKKTHEDLVFFQENNKKTAKEFASQIDELKRQLRKANEDRDDYKHRYESSLAARERENRKFQETAEELKENSLRLEDIIRLLKDRITELEKDKAEQEAEYNNLMAQYNQLLAETSGDDFGSSAEFDIQMRKMEEEMQKQLAEMNKQLKANEEKMNKLEEEKAQLAKELQQSKESFEKDLARLEELVKIKRKLEKEVEYLTDRLSEESEESEDLKAQIQKLRLQIDDASREESAVTDRKDKNEKSAKELQATLKKLQAEKEKLEKEARKQREELEKVKRNKEAEVRKLKQKLQEENKKRAEKEAEGKPKKNVKEMEVMLKGIQDEKAKLEENLKEMREQLNRMKFDKESAETKVNGATQRITELEKETVRLRNRRNHYKRATLRLSGKASEENSKANSIENELSPKQKRLSLQVGSPKSPEKRRSTYKPPNNI